MGGYWKTEYGVRYKQSVKGKIANTRHKRLRKRRHSALVAELKNKPCLDCGIRFHPCAMQFDHVRGEKIEQVSRMLDCSLDLILAEIAKCDLVCSNCHHIRTYNRTIRIEEG